MFICCCCEEGSARLECYTNHYVAMFFPFSNSLQRQVCVYVYMHVNMCFASNPFMCKSYAQTLLIKILVIFNQWCVQRRQREKLRHVTSEGRR